MLKKASALLLVGIIVFIPGQLVAQQAKCAGSAVSSLILPSTPNVNALMVYVAFPSGGEAGTDNFPSFAATAAQHLTNYYDEMSYGTHHINVQVIQRPSPNQGKAFIANNPLSYYDDYVAPPRASELNTQILNEAYAENPHVFDGISVVFMFIGGIFS